MLYEHALTHKQENETNPFNNMLIFLYCIHFYCHSCEIWLLFLKENEILEFLLCFLIQYTAEHNKIYVFLSIGCRFLLFVYGKETE